MNLDKTIINARKIVEKLEMIASTIKVSNKPIEKLTTAINQEEEKNILMNALYKEVCYLTEKDIRKYDIKYFESINKRIKYLSNKNKSYTQLKKPSEIGSDAYNLSLVQCDQIFSMLNLEGLNLSSSVVCKAIGKECTNNKYKLPSSVRNFTDEELKYFQYIYEKLIEKK